MKCGRSTSRNKYWKVQMIISRWFKGSRLVRADSIRLFSRNSNPSPLGEGRLIKYQSHIYRRKESYRGDYIIQRAQGCNVNAAVNINAIVNVNVAALVFVAAGAVLIVAAFVFVFVAIYGQNKN